MCFGRGSAPKTTTRPGQAQTPQPTPKKIPGVITELPAAHTRGPDLTALLQDKFGRGKWKVEMRNDKMGCGGSKPKKDEEGGGSDAVKQVTHKESQKETKKAHQHSQARGNISQSEERRTAELVRRQRDGAAEQERQRQVEAKRIKDAELRKQQEEELERAREAEVRKKQEEEKERLRQQEIKRAQDAEIQRQEEAERRAWEAQQKQNEKEEKLRLEKEKAMRLEKEQEEARQKVKDAVREAEKVLREAELKREQVRKMREDRKLGRGKRQSIPRLKDGEAVQRPLSYAGEGNPSSHHQAIERQFPPLTVPDSQTFTDRTPGIASSGAQAGSPSALRSDSRFKGLANPNRPNAFPPTPTPTEASSSVSGTESGGKSPRGPLGTTQLQTRPPILSPYPTPPVSTTGSQHSTSPPPPETTSSRYTIHVDSITDPRSVDQPRPARNGAATLNRTPSSSVRRYSVLTESSSGSATSLAPSVTPTHERMLRKVRNEFAQKSQPGYWRGPPYLSIADLVKILNIKRVAAILPVFMSHNDRPDIEVAQKICGNPRLRMDDRGDPTAYDRVLAVLIQLNKTKHFDQFLRNEVNNSHLPFSMGDGKLYSGLSEQPLAFLSRREGWDQADRKRLYESQWHVLAPIFGPREATDVIKHYEISPLHPLPFKQIDMGDSSTNMAGHFSQVKGVVIDASHNRFGSYSKFAVKHLRLAGSLTNFENEVNNLQRLNSHEHPHIVKLLFTLELLGPNKLQSEYVLVFPLAKGNLRNFWQTIHPRKQQVPAVSRWALDQCLGLAGALSVVHGVTQGPGTQGQPLDRRDTGDSDALEPIYGIHSDIKPENILWFGPQTSHPLPPNDYGVLQLADFGVSTFHETESRSNATNGPHTKTYSSPESHLGARKSRAFDIWSLGCVFLEFISYIVLGSEQRDFSEARLTMANEAQTGEIASDAFYIIDYVVQGRGLRKQTTPRAQLNPAVVNVSSPAANYF
ncbi:hypothetical protein OQA88_8725 [Cercophora sp. LCS_1]